MCQPLDLGLSSHPGKSIKETRVQKKLGKKRESEKCNQFSKFKKYLNTEDGEMTTLNSHFYFF